MLPLSCRLHIGSHHLSSDIPPHSKEEGLYQPPTDSLKYDTKPLLEAEGSANYTE